MIYSFFFQCFKKLSDMAPNQKTSYLNPNLLKSKYSIRNWEMEKPLKIH